MKRLLYIPLLLILILSCKKDADDVTPQSAVQSLDGKWLLTEIEQTVNGKKVWQPAGTMQSQYLIFRYDGVILNEDGKASCCLPKILNINNTPMDVIPQSAISYNGDCSLILCGSCPVWDIEQKGNEMIIEQCQIPRSKYVRK